MLDWDFLKNCQYRFVPNHGELARKLMEVPGEEFPIVTTSSGVKAGEEIIQKVYKLVD
jgi:hypothetical protein